MALAKGIVNYMDVQLVPPGKYGLSIVRPYEWVMQPELATRPVSKSIWGILFLV